MDITSLPEWKSAPGHIARLMPKDFTLRCGVGEDGGEYVAVHTLECQFHVIFPLEMLNGPVMEASVNNLLGCLRQHSTVH